MMQPEPRTRLIVQSGANGSLSTIVPAYGSLTSTRSSAAQSSLYGDWFLGSAMRSNEELDVVRGQLAEAAGELHALPEHEIDVALRQPARSLPPPVPGVAGLRLDQVREDRVHDVALGLGEPVQGVRHLKVGIGADPERAGPAPGRAVATRARRRRAPWSSAGTIAGREPRIASPASHRPASARASDAGALSRMCVIALQRGT
jgi:hypothetical protein